MATNSKAVNWQLLSSEDISDLQKLREFCLRFSQLIGGSEIILLDGVLSAGKTEFVRQMASLLLQRSVTSSPSYALHHEYAGSDSHERIDHWDLYRLKDEDDLESSGFWDQLQNKNLIFIEWAERLNQDWLPKERKCFRIEIQLHEKSRALKLYQAA